jgi:hypothetical protein
VSAAASKKAARFRSCFGAGEMRVRNYRRKAPWIGKAHAFHEVPAEPVSAAFEPPSGFEEKRTQANGTEEATGVPEAVGSISHGGRKRHRVNHRPVAEVGIAP